MDALKFIKEFYRMCDYYSGGFCKGCPRKAEPNCDELIMEDDELNKLIADVEKWSKEHPPKTRLQDFQKKYPNASMGPYGTSTICCIDLGYCKNDCDLFKGNCVNCWNMPVEDE